MIEGQNTHKGKILVTGATGFLGRHLVSGILAAGWEVRALVRNASGRDLSYLAGAEIAEGDVLDVASVEKALDGVEQVVHAAAVVSFWRKKRAEMRKANVEGTANVVNCALEAGIQRLVHISSNGVFGGPPGLTIDESWRKPPGKGHSYYGKTKYYAEMEVYRAESEGLPMVMLNPGVVIGPGDWQAGPPKIFSVVYKGLRFYNRGGTSLVAVEDVVSAAILGLEGKLTEGERYLMVAETLPQKEFLGVVAEALGKKPPSVLLPAWVSLAVGYISEGIAFFTGKEPVISLETMKSATRTTHYNSRKIEAAGLLFTPIREAIRRTAAAFLQDQRR
jgi:nucleoside-diphosphate-sugar epimerase